jgi:hypothetical protein
MILRAVFAATVAYLMITPTFALPADQGGPPVQPRDFRFSFGCDNADVAIDKDAPRSP